MKIRLGFGSLCGATLFGNERGGTTVSDFSIQPGVPVSRLYKGVAMNVGTRQSLVKRSG